MGDLLELTARAEPSHFWFRGFRNHLAPVIHGIAAGRRNLRIIDCGCGTGYNLMNLLHPYGQTFAFDRTVDALRRARTARRPLVRADIQQIPFASNSFDLATSFDVIQSVPDDTQALRELARIIKPGGHLVLNVTALDVLDGDHSDVWGEFRRYTAQRAERLLKGAGLEPVRVTYLFGSLVPLMLAVRWVQKVLRPIRPPDGDADLTIPPPPINTMLTLLVSGEAALARRQVWLPFGSSLLIVAKKPRD